MFEFKTKRSTLAISICLTFAIVIASCAMTPTQRYATTRASFNSMLENQYIPFFESQTPKVQQELRDKAAPIIHEMSDALDIYYRSLSVDGEDPEARLEFYLSIKNKLINLLTKYGLELMED